MTEVLKHSLTLLAKEARKSESDIHILNLSLELLAGSWEQVNESWIASEHPCINIPTDGPEAPCGALILELEESTAHAGRLPLSNPRRCQ